MDPGVLGGALGSIAVTADFFSKPILNSPYAYPARHWELDPSGQPTQRVVEARRKAEFITPIPKPKKRKAEQQSMVFDEGEGLSSQDQQYETTAIINQVREQVEQWRGIQNSSQWQVTPETARLLQRCTASPKEGQT